MRLASAVLFLVCAFSCRAFGSTLTLGGSIRQSITDGTGPAVSNMSLNNITDGQAFTLVLDSATGITGPGLYNLTGASLVFSVPDASATENNFGTISLSVTANGGFDDFSLLACISGADCFSGNFLTANFRIAAGLIGGSSVATTGLDQPHPLDLLEDDGVTDIHASFNTYSNTAQVVTVTPEPAYGSLLAIGFSAMVASARVRQRLLRHT